jgi:hypothetical protein
VKGYHAIPRRAYHPHPRVHGLNGFKEVIETVIWGLEQLGHKVAYSVNRLSADARNIVFGGQMLSLEAQKDLRTTLSFIVSNGLTTWIQPMSGRRSNPISLDSKYGITANSIWIFGRGMAQKYNVKIVTVGFAPILERIS